MATGSGTPLNLKQFKEMENLYNIGDTLTAKKYQTGKDGCVRENTPFVWQDIVITKAIPPTEPLTQYSEYRYDYESKEMNSFKYPVFTGNIGEQLLTSYIKPKA